MRRPARSGVAILAVYVAVCAATIGLSGRHIRPLFEGIGPSAPYRWVKPPPLFAPGNVTPAPLSSDVSLSAMDTAFQVSTSDAQFSLNIPAHGVAPKAGAQTARFLITPGDPAKLAPLPAGLRPAGNAYHATISYEPGGADASPLAKPGNVTLLVPEPVKSIQYSPDGRTWQSLPTQALANATTVGSTFSAAGWYLGAADAATAQPGTLAGKPAAAKRLSTVLIAVLVVGLMALLIGIPALLRRRHEQQRKHRPPPRGRSRGRTPPPGPKRS